MRRVYCCDLLRFRWAERTVLGEPPSDVHARRNLDAFVDGQRMIVFGKACHPYLSNNLSLYLRTELSSMLRS